MEWAAGCNRRHSESEGDVHSAGEGRVVQFQDGSGAESREPVRQIEHQGCLEYNARVQILGIGSIPGETRPAVLLVVPQDPLIAGEERLFPVPDILNRHLHDEP